MIHTMKKILTTLLLALMTILAVAQTADDLTLKFLGIPIDGNKSSMVAELKKKGFRQHPYSEELLVGEFNGRESHIGFAENRGKLYRVAVFDANTMDESQIRIRYNILLRQFENSNGKYLTPLLVSNEPIPEDEDISYEMSVNKKDYSATFVYNPAYNNEELRKRINDELIESAKKAFDMFYENTGKEDDEMSEESYQIIADSLFSKRIQEISNGVVWFTIFENYGKYYIGIFYDNNNNKANGEDL